MDLRPWEGAEGQERFPHPGKAPNGREISWVIKGASEAERRVQKLVCGRQDRERPTQIISATAMRPPT